MTYTPGTSGQRVSVPNPGPPCSPDYKNTSLAVAVGTTVRVWDVSACGHDPSSSAVMAKATVSPTAISWNRNNKVAAVGLENGRVQIRYANGTCMSTLPDDYYSGTEEDAHPVSSLSWSTGSKTLAVGHVGGRVSVHDMTTKQHLSKVVHEERGSALGGGKLKAVGLQHHPDDAFLAIGGKDSVELYSLHLEQAKGSCVCSASSVVKNDACFTSVSVATGKPYLAAGSDRNGIVAVWDYSTETELACDKFRHAHKGSTKVALSPLEPYLMYSAGMDGILKMQDLRAPSSIASPTAMASVSSTAGISSMSIHEHSGDVALGTNDGYVYIFESGLKSRKPKLSALFADERSSQESPVLAVDWARSFHNVTLHARQMVTESERAAATPTSSVRVRDDVKEAERSDDVPAMLPASADTARTASPGSATPLVRRMSTPDPWRIRAGNVVDGDANTPGSSAGRERAPAPAEATASAKKSGVQHQRSPHATEAKGGQEAAVSDQAGAVGEDVSKLILALHLDMVQMHEHHMGEVEALRKEIRALKELVAQTAKPSGDIWGV